MKKRLQHKKDTGDIREVVTESISVTTVLEVHVHPRDPLLQQHHSYGYGSPRHVRWIKNGGGGGSFALNVDQILVRHDFQLYAVIDTRLGLFGWFAVLSFFF